MLTSVEATPSPLTSSTTSVDDRGDDSINHYTDNNGTHSEIAHRTHFGNNNSKARTAVGH